MENSLNFEWQSCTLMQWIVDPLSELNMHFCILMLQWSSPSSLQNFNINSLDKFPSLLDGEIYGTLTTFLVVGPLPLQWDVFHSFYFSLHFHKIIHYIHTYNAQNFIYIYAEINMFFLQKILSEFCQLLYNSFSVISSHF